ncbi:MAG: hypothetical protein FJY55_10220 [Betaproteobacteria bacterium]|nr:hypothetical protein [Betaproteobacteria bacterium]
MAKSKYVMFVMTNCVPGADVEFNDWYDRIHVPDVLKVPGIVAAQRYKLTSEQRRTTRPNFGYLAVYEVESSDLRGTFAAMNEGLKDAYKSASLDPDTWAYFFKPVGRRQVKAVSRPAARKKAGKAASAKGKKRPVNPSASRAKGGAAARKRR